MSGLIENYGGDGYLVFFGVLEMMAREFDIDNPGISTFSRKFLKKKLQVSGQKMAKVFTFCEINNRFIVTYTERNITINCNKLAELCDTWTKKLLRSKIEVSSPQRDKKKEVREKKENNKDIYPVIFSSWNQQKIIVHKKINDKMRQKMNTAIKDYGAEEILKGICNYGKIFKSDKHYYSHRYTLEDFLPRALKNFVDEALPFDTYKNRDSNKKQSPSNEPPPRIMQGGEPYQNERTK